MSFYQELPYPVFVASGAVLTSGGTENLKPGQLALVDSSTYQALGAGASPISHPSVLIAQGSWHSQDRLTKFIAGLQQSTKTQDFKAKDAIEFQRSYPVLPSQDIVQIGWDGVNPTNSLSFECGKSYYFKVNVTGEDVYRSMSRPLYRFIELRTDCCPGATNCNTACTDAVDPTYYAKRLANAINDDVELKYFVKAEAVVSNYSATSATHNVWTLTLCDNGDVPALASIQGTYPTYTISRISRSGSTSVYQTVLPTATTPTGFTPAGSILLAVCGTCPSGYTSVGAKDVYTVRRAIAGTEALSVSGQAAFVSTANTDYSTTGTLFLGQDASVATIQVAVATGTVVTPVKDDIVTFSHTNPAQCTPSAASAVSWVQGTTQYLPTQPIYLTLQKTCGGSNQLAALQAFYANDPIIVANSIVVAQSGNCADSYTASQYADVPVTDDCLSPAVASFKSKVQSFNGFAWSTIPPSGFVAQNTPPASPLYAGVRITGAFVDTKFGNCSFEPTDYYSVRPVRITVTQVNEDGNPCDATVAVNKLQYGTVATQTGEWLIRQYLKYASNEAYNVWSADPRMRDVYDQNVLQFIDRSALYKVYYLVYTMDRFKANWATMQPNDKYETIIAFPVGTDTTTFETVFAGYFSQVGVNLVERDI